MLSRSVRFLSRRYSQAVTFRTSESSPTQQNENQIGLFYTMNNDVCKQLFAHGGLPKSFTKQTKTFTETALMVRLPALDIINCIKATDFDKPVVRYVIFGEKGAGKSLTLAHMLHFAHEDGYLIVHVPWVSDWLRRLPRDKEMSNSQSREGFVDIPLDAAAWLLHFKMQNQGLLKSADLKTSKEYVWSKREKTAEGAPLAELVEHGIARVKYACDVIDVLLKEIKLLSNAKKCKTFVAIDGFNCFFYPLTRLSTPTKKKVTPDEVSLTQPFMEITKNDWTNGVVVVTTDQLAVPDDRQENHLPKYLLYQKGFEHLDPFVPVEIGRYTEREFVSCASYYRDRLWLRGPPELEGELKLASACNPYSFMELCAPLQLFAHGGLPKSFTKQTKTFTETALMVRLPALDIINCIKAKDFDKPVVRYVIYGEKGAGKSLTLAHMLHFAHEDGYLIVHVPWVSDWLRRLPRDKEMSNSQSREGFVDIPLDAAAWLLHFKMQNQGLLKSVDLKTSKKYVWSKREKTAEGAPLAELVEHGIARVKYACDVIDVLLKEIKLLSNAKKCKTFVAIDGFNCFFYPLTRLSTPTKKKVTPDEVSLTQPFMEITKNDWTNGVVVVTTDQLAVPDDRQENHLPKYLLYQKGFEHLDPFVPVEIGRYTEREFVSCASYYRDRLWLRGPPELEGELKLASACNPYSFMELCAPL